jgi:hypothetical protein
MQRTLTLVAKSLQGLANMTSFGIKEPWMEPMNQFLSAHRQGLKDFIDSICSYSIDEDADNVIPPPYATPTTILARLPPISREGFPSLPYLIDQPRNYAVLVKIWLEAYAQFPKVSLFEGPILEFHETCTILNKLAIESLDQAEQAERPSSDLSSRWQDLLQQGEGNATPKSTEVKAGFSLFPKPANTAASSQGSTTGPLESPTENPEVGSGYYLDIDTNDGNFSSSSNSKSRFSDIVGGFKRKVRRGITPGSEDDT